MALSEQFHSTKPTWKVWPSAFEAALGPDASQRSGVFSLTDSDAEDAHSQRPPTPRVLFAEDVPEKADTEYEPTTPAKSEDLFREIIGDDVPEEAWKGHDMK